jgi:biotin carboxyl carrier protein
VRQLELRIEEARANLGAAAAREADAKAVVGRGAALHARGFQSDEAQEKARHAQEVEDQSVIAARKRLDTLTVELDAARNGTFLGDSYNDAPSSLQRTRELALRIAETEATLDAVRRKIDALQGQLAAERDRLAAHSKAVLTAPVEGQLWTVQAAPGEYVRKGQDLLTVLDCSTVMVTASVTPVFFLHNFIVPLPCAVACLFQFAVSQLNLRFCHWLSLLFVKVYVRPGIAAGSEDFQKRPGVSCRCGPLSSALVSAQGQFQSPVIDEDLRHQCLSRFGVCLNSGWRKVVRNWSAQCGLLCS